MKYMLFATLIAAQSWIATFEARLNEQAGAHYGSDYHYSAPINLVATAPGLAAVPILNQAEQYLTDEERSGLVDDIASYLPPVPDPFGGTP